MLDSTLETIGRFDEHPRGEGFGLLDHEGAIEHEKLLLGDCGFGADRSGDICVGKIEQPEHVVQLVSADERIDSSSVVARVGKIRRRPLELAIQSPGGRKERIAPSLDIEPTSGHSPEVPIVSIDLLIRIVAIRAELVGRREHDFTMKRFDRPSLLDELDGQIFEQFGMGWGFAKFPEVIWGTDESTSEMVLPDPIDHHAGCQWVFA